MTVRKAVKDDLDGVLELYAHLFSSEDYSDADEFRSKWDEILGFSGLVYFVSEHRGRLTASCNISIIPNMTRGKRSYALIENVITHPDFRRMGHGRAVVEQAVRHAKTCNCYKIMLLSTSSKERQTAHKFYESLGFDGDSKRGFCIKF